MLNKANSNSNQVLSAQRYAFTGVRHTRAAAAAHPLEFEVSRYRTSKFTRCFLPAHFRMWNDLSYHVFGTWMLDGFKVQSTIGCFPKLCFLQFSVAQVLVGFPKQLRNNFIFPTCSCAAGFNNNNVAEYEVSGSWHYNWQILFDSRCQTIDFLLYLGCRCSLSDVIMSDRFLSVELASSPP